MIERLKKGDPLLKRILRVEPIEHQPFSAFVESASAIVPPGHDWKEYGHVVDLIGHEITVDGKIIQNGSCTCEWFQFKLYKRIANEKPARCEHIKRYLEVVAESLLTQWVRTHKEQIALARARAIAGRKLNR